MIWSSILSSMRDKSFHSSKTVNRGWGEGMSKSRIVHPISIQHTPSHIAERSNSNCLLETVLFVHINYTLAHAKHRQFLNVFVPRMRHVRITNGGRNRKDQTPGSLRIG